MMQIISARRCNPLSHPKPRGNLPALQGLRYENRLFKALARWNMKAEHNPWFMYEARGYQPQFCCPDILLYHDLFLVVIEVKLTYRKEAEEKLRDLYVPVVKLALGQERVYPLVIVRNLTPAAPEPSLSLPEALTKSAVSGIGLFQYMG
jgi:hypothetical protein